MNVLEVTAARMREWETLVQRESSFSMLQSWEWGSFKHRLGWQVFRVAVEDAGELVAGAQMLVRPLPLGLSLAYVPRGPVGSWRDPRVAQRLFAELCRLARNQGAVFLKVEPAARPDSPAIALLEASGFQRSAATNQPRATILLDLSQGEASILHNMRKKTRQYIHRAQREDITIRFGTSADLPAYYDLLRRTGRRQHFAPRSPYYYRCEWEAFSADGHTAMLLAYSQGRLIAMRVVCRFGLHAAEFHAGSISVPGLHPSYLLVWEAIKWAAANGCQTYDLWGIPDEIAETGPGDQPSANRDDGLWGVYQFKRGFGDKVVSYIGAYDYVARPHLYRLLNYVLSQGKWWERVAAVFDSPGFGPPIQPGVQPAGGEQ